MVSHVTLALSANSNRPYCASRRQRCSERWSSTTSTTVTDTSATKMVDAIAVNIVWRAQKDPTMKSETHAASKNTMAVAAANRRGVNH